jgi:hypothetical protein
MEKIISTTYRMRYYSCVNKNYMIPFLFLKVKKHIENADIETLKNTNPDGFQLFTLYKSFLTLLQNSYFPDAMLSSQGRKNQLIANIEDVISNGTHENKTLGRYFLMKYYLEIEEDKAKASTYLSELHIQYPNNKVFFQLLTN